MSAVAGLLIMGIGVNMLLEKDIKVANLLPAIVVPFLYFPLYDLIMRSIMASIIRTPPLRRRGGKRSNGPAATWLCWTASRRT